MTQAEEFARAARSLRDEASRDARLLERAAELASNFKRELDWWADRHDATIHVGDAVELVNRRATVLEKIPGRNVRVREADGQEAIWSTLNVDVQRRS